MEQLFRRLGWSGIVLSIIITGWSQYLNIKDTVALGLSAKIWQTIGLGLFFLVITLMLLQLQKNQDRQRNQIRRINSNNKISPFTNQRLFLSELFLDIDTIVNKKFEECDIYGPAKIHFTGILNMGGCTISGEIENTLLDISPMRRIKGAVTFVNCTFNACSFIDIKIIIDSKNDPVNAKYFKDFWQHPFPPSFL